MNQLRFVAFLVSFAALLWLSALGQTSQTPATPAAPPAGVTIPSSPPLNAAPDTSSMPSANSTGAPRFKIKFAPTQKRPTVKQLPDTPLIPGVTVQRLADRDETQPAQGVAPPRQSIATSQESSDDGVRRPLVFSIQPFPIQGSRDFTLAKKMGNELPNPNLDRGIFLPHHTYLLGNSCGSIVSYNFSQGDNPQLESVTTCTPSGIVATRRAEGQGQKPPTPQIQKTVLRQPQ